MSSRFATLLALALVSIPSIAYAAPDAPAEAPKRFSLQLDGGLNFLMPFYEFQVGYRLPLLDDRLEPFLSYAPLSASLSPANQFTVTQLGLRYYPFPRARFSPFVTTAVSYVTNTLSSGYNAPGLNVGVGADWMFYPNVGLTGSFSLSYPMLFRPEVGLKVAF
ncbi:MAG TPA: hypothetical protein V6D47_01385 [Oscillatoriaceae cyanobacterium]